MIKKILKEIKKFDYITIHGHERPDGDCIGSQIGLRDILRNTFPNKKVYAVGPTSEYVSFIGKLDDVDDDVFKEVLAIVVDCATSERIADKRALNAKELIKIDHHMAVDDYGVISWVDDKSSSCCQMIVEFMLKNKMKLSIEGANALYTGIVTDSGRFRFDSVKGKTLRLASVLLDKGVNVSKIDENLSLESIESMKLKGYILENFQTTAEGFAYFFMTREVIERFKVTDEEASAQVSQIGSIKGYPVWALFIYYPEEIRVRIRSRGPRVDLLAAKYSGGGHQKASGCSVKSDSDIQSLINDVNNILIDYKKQEE